MENFSSFNNNELEYPAPRLDIKKFLKKKNVFYVAGIVIFFLFINFVFFSAPSDFPEGTIVNIKDGAGLRSVSRDFKKDNLIRSRVVFETLIITFGGDKNLVSGDYLFENKISVFEMARRISKGDKHLAPVKVTIPEGFNVNEISKVFVSRLANFDANRFLGEAKEGYLFPDTYFFLTTDNEKDVLDSMTKNYEQKINSIRPKITASGKTEKEIIIMASLLEGEAKGDADRDIISGILWKRISIGMPLQVDAEPNTYKTKGLPQNPISNPGLKAIESAINPKSSSYLYYLHDKDGNVHYAKTFAEHLVNKQKYLKN